MNGPVTSAMLLIPAKRPIATTSFESSVMSPTMFRRMGWFPDRLPARPRIRSAQAYDLETPKRNVVRAEPTSPTMRTLLRPMRSEEHNQVNKVGRIHEYVSYLQGVPSSEPCKAQRRRRHFPTVPSNIRLEMALRLHPGKRSSARASFRNPTEVILGELTLLTY